MSIFSLSLIDAQYQSPVFDNRLGCLLYPCHNSWRLADNGNIYANFDGDSGLLPVSGDHWSREFFWNSKKENDEIKKVRKSF